MMEGWMGVLPCLPGQVREEAAKVFLSGLSSLSFLTSSFDMVQTQPFEAQSGALTDWPQQKEQARIL